MIQLHHLKNEVMKKQICISSRGFSAHVDFSDLEKLGWEFSDLYESVAFARGISLEEAEEWEKKNYHVRLFNNGNGVYWISSDNKHGDTGDAQWPGDAAKTEKDIQALYASGELWEVFEGEE
jgi:hypothetical protein